MDDSSKAAILIAFGSVLMGLSNVDLVAKIGFLLTITGLLMWTIRYKQEKKVGVNGN